MKWDVCMHVCEGGCVCVCEVGCVYVKGDVCMCNQVMCTCSR